MTRVLLVEADPHKRDVLASLLRQDGHTVATAGNIPEALACVNAARFDLVVAERFPREGESLEFVAACHAADPALQVVILTGESAIESAAEALRRGSLEFLAKPATHAEFCAVVASALARGIIQRENVALRNQVERLGFTSELVGDGPAMRDVKERIALVAPTDATVLIEGETGTGKELAARAIHRASARVDAPFLAVNCAAFPESLLDSELFGHEKGSFTGADRTRPGWFEAADGGTLFLDEAGEMSLALQAKLLRVLTDRHIVRVGSRVARAVDVRLVLATCQDLRRWVAAGTFREDLYYRVAVVPLAMPPLRSRPEDIPLLAELFVASAARDLKVPRRPIAPRAMDKLRAYAFPGNIRELRNLIERACILARGATIEPSDFPLGDGAEHAAGAGADPVRTCARALPDTIDLRETLERLERELLTRALADADGVQAEAARRLNLARGDIGYKIRKYAIPQPLKAPKTFL